MSVRGLGAPNEGVAAEPAAARNNTKATNRPASATTKPLAGNISPGVGQTTKTKLDRVPVPDTAAALREAVIRMNVILELMQDWPVESRVVGETAGKLGIAFSNAVRVVLMLKTRGDVADEALGRAADDLVTASYNDRKYEHGQRCVNALRVRAATDYVREYMALRFQKIPGNDAAKEAIRANIVTWIEPHTNELKGGYNLGHEVFKRLDTATTNRGPDDVALLLARLYDDGRGRVPISLDLPASDIDQLESRLQGARESSDLDKAKALIALYRDLSLKRPA